jgi:hypothetical protein
MAKLKCYDRKRHEGHNLRRRIEHACSDHDSASRRRNDPATSRACGDATPSNFEPLPTGPKPVTNLERLPDGTANRSVLVGDTNPILRPGQPRQ